MVDKMLDEEVDHCTVWQPSHAPLDFGYHVLRKGLFASSLVDGLVQNPLPALSTRLKNHTRTHRELLTFRKMVSVFESLSSK